MAYIPDLAPYTYHRPEPDVLAVGWLDSSQPFDTAEPSDELREALTGLVGRRMNLFRGSHTCQFCKGAPPAMGNGEVRVKKSGKWYSAPVMIYHYVAIHHYKPPQEFIDAALNPDEVGTDGAFRIGEFRC
jgi:hypothetical protein